MSCVLRASSRPRAFIASHVRILCQPRLAPLRNLRNIQTVSIPAAGSSTHPKLQVYRIPTACKFSTAATNVSSDKPRLPSESHPAADLPIISTDDRKTTILWSSQNESRFHHIWLRDHCRCPTCFHPGAKQRLLNTFEIPRDIKPQRVQALAEGLEITWSAPGVEHHASLYPWAWLKAHTYDPPTTPPSVFDERTLWGAEIANSPPTMSYTEVMHENDQGLCKWLCHIDRFGFCFVSGVPATPEATEELAKRIGSLRETQYGKFWEISPGLSETNTGDSTIALDAHTDGSYNSDPSGLMVLHAISHTGGSGGASLLVDGFHVASQMKQLHPKAYELLSRIPIPTHAAGDASMLYQPSVPSGFPPLRHDNLTGELVQIRWCNDDRSVMDRLNPELVEPWYDAIRTWDRLLKSAEFEYWVQLRPGTVLVFNNHRVLHGRSAFTGMRRLCGTFIGMDEYVSRMGVLKERIREGQRGIWSLGL